MTSIKEKSTSSLHETSNVTIRKRPDILKNNMAHLVKRTLNPDFGGSLLIDSILSQDEEKDVVSMMIMADEHDSYNQLPSFCTSTQMGGRDPKRRPYSPLLSPLRTPSADRSDLRQLHSVITRKIKQLLRGTNDLHH